MSEPTLDLRSALAILRRSRSELVVTAALGAALGIAFTLLKPVVYTSTAMILLPASGTSADQAASETETQIRIATSAGVLAPAAAALRPPMPLDAAAEHVQVSAPTFRLLQITATGETPDLAHSLAQSVAESDVTFLANGPSSLKNAQQALVARQRKQLQASLNAVNDEIEKATARRAAESPVSPEGRADASAVSQLTAQQADLVLQLDRLASEASQTSSGATASVIQPASPAKPPNLAIQLVGAVLLGAAAAVTIAAIAILLVCRRDRRLHSRDDFADAVGSPVIASIQSRTPQNVAAWSALLAEYDPGNVDAWALRQALRQSVFGESAIPGRHGDDGAATGQPVSITVVTLSDDLRGLAMGPQIASYAASVGVRTQLVAAQRHASAASLWAACSREPGDEEVRPGLFVSVRPSTDPDQESRPATAEEHHVDLTVVLAVVDRSEPALGEVPQTSLTVLALSPASATAEELAQAAVTADNAGRRIAGIIVADPDSSDRTTGRLLQHERNHQVPLPIRLTGMSGPTPSADVSRPYRRPR